MALSRETILAANDMKKVNVTVPEWGGDVWVRMLTGVERDVLDQSIAAARDTAEKTGMPGRYRVLSAIAFTTDEEGVRLFTVKDADDLNDKAGAALDRIVDAGMKLNGMREADAEEAVKNS